MDKSSFDLSLKGSKYNIKLYIILHKYTFIYFLLYLIKYLFCMQYCIRLHKRKKLRILVDGFFKIVSTLLTTFSSLKNEIDPSGLVVCLKFQWRELSSPSIHNFSQHMNFITFLNVILYEDTNTKVRKSSSSIHYWVKRNYIMCIGE